MIPKRRKAKKFGTDRGGPIRCREHLQWVRGHECVISEYLCFEDRIQAAHVRTGTDGGTGMKPSDCYAIPLCGFHHRLQHEIGEAAFEKEYRIDMKSLAREMWARSPAGIRYRREHEAKP